jgi:hypothetical protein
MPSCNRSTGRGGAAAALGLALALLAGLSATSTPAAAATAGTARTQATSDASTGYTFSKRFTVPYSANQQGLAYADGIHYAGFDTGNGYGRIVAYDDNGAEVKRTPSLPLGHAAEVSYRAADGNLYVAMYAGGSGLKVGVVDMRPATPTLVRTYDFSYLGTRGMVAIDNTRDQMVVKSGPKEGPHTFTTTDMQGKIVGQFTDVSQGLGQGLEVVGDDLLLYTSAADFSSNTITVYSRTGTVRSKIHVPVASEGEGLSVDHRTGQLHVGFRNHAIYRMSPAYLPSSPTSSTSNRLVNGGAESSAAGSGNHVKVSLPGWSVTGGMTAIRYGANRGYPSATGAGPADRRHAFFSGGTVATATISQVVSTSDAAAVIDRGAGTFELSGWLGGYRWQTDNAKVVATFRNSAGTAIGSSSIGPVTPRDRAGVTGLLKRGVTGKVPVGTRSVRVVVTATRGGGTNNDGYVDSLRLVIG